MRQTQIFRWQYYALGLSLLAGSLSACLGFVGFESKEFVVGLYGRLVTEREKYMKFRVLLGLNQRNL